MFERMFHYVTTQILVRIEVNAKQILTLSYDANYSDEKRTEI